MDRLRETVASRITRDDALIITAEGERSQKTNRDRAFSRLEALITATAGLPRYRKPTKPSKQAREQRLRAKRIQGMKKSARSLGAEDL
jgi:ribosome-associated protein